MDLVEVLVMALFLMAARKVQSKPSKPPVLRNTSSSTTTAEPEIPKLRLMDGGSNCSGRVELEVIGSLANQTPTDSTERETVTSVSHLPSLTFTTPEDLKPTSPDRNLQTTCIILGFLLFLSIVIIIILLLKRQKKNDCVISSAPVSAPILMNHMVQKLTTGGDVSLSVHKTEGVTPSAAHEDSDSDYEDYDFSKKPPVPFSNFYTSFHYQATGDQVSPPHNFPKLTMRQETKRPKDYRQTDLTAEDSDSTSSGDSDWYENIHKPQQQVQQQGDEPSFAGLTVFAKPWSNGLTGSGNDSSGSSEHHNM
ncbi:PREDICTED: T-cell differentiation antigen CD6 [Thamnophis sirtalis]|uniref:T-cell differentiation antigen CD6 n=1 Tax=Thamnophis sirtalis TaxID=35019 RepID=A0A6I9YRF0_9SAUR|nr:PREDICTED: T-cell differentiation antigen CD6 [Thamnophis sirtalis]